MYNDLFSIGPFTVHGYGLMIAIGIILAYYTADKRARANGQNSDIVWGLTVCAVVFGLASAKLLYLIMGIKEIISNPRLLLDFSNGFVVYGGIIGGIAAGYIYCRIRKEKFLGYSDLILTSVALAQGFGRIGCFLAGCCYGIETDGPLSIVFTHSDFAPNNVHLFPSQLASSALDFLNFIVLSIILKKKKVDGEATACYLIFYSIGRFFIEFFRGDLIRGSIGILSTSQFISIFTLLAGIIAFFFIRKTGSRYTAS